MARRVRIRSGRNQVQLPNGFAYNDGDEVVLTEEEFEQIESSALDTLVEDLGEVGGGPMVTVEHGAVAGTARPDGAAAVYWIGSVEPTNAAAHDLWYDTTA